MYPIFFTINKFHVFSYSIGPLYIHAYGVMLAISFLAGLLLLIREGKKVGFSSEDMIDLTIYIILLSIIGGRIMYVLLSMDEYSTQPLSALKIYEGGLSYHGGAIGGFIAAFLYAWRKKINGWKLVDTGIPALVLGAAIARWGCFLNGCCFGHEWHGPWAVIFPALGDHLPRHPAQLYDSALNLLLLVILFQLKKLKKKEGDMFAFYLMGFAVLRFTTEIFRAGATGKAFIFSWLTEAQAASFLIFAVGLAVFLLRPGKIPGTIPVSPLPAATVQSDKKNKPKKSAEEPVKKTKRKKR